jgi:protein-S-isoprenylcysteine O-methyltransferase Ste14
MQNLQGKLPLILSAAFAIAIISFGAPDIAAWTGATRTLGACILLLYLAWVALETRVAIGETRRAHTSIDKSTFELYAVGRACTVLVALALGSPEPSPLRLAIGFAIFAFGVSLRVLAIQTLGRFYSHRVRVADDQRVVTRGPYRFLRHPAYTGMLVAHAGFLAVFYHPLAVAAFALLFVPAVVARILVEEKALMSLDGYADYKKSRARLVPGVW